MKELFFTNGTHFPIGTIYGIGQNYAKHAEEMKSLLPRGERIIFIKPSIAYIQDGETIVLPDYSNEVHYEGELVVVINKYCAGISADDAWDYIAGFGVGIDATLRDLQTQAKQKGTPWAIAKGFRTSAPISKIIPRDEFQDNQQINFQLKLNGELRQVGNSAEMIYSVPELIEYLSKIFTLDRGDVIFTGTPEGVGEIHKDDVIEIEIPKKTSLRVIAR
ncbi:MAG: fumarylacetoacetate hydrolase family protein [Candidatus Kapabacteria bacterium]|nr:fumarylacetoacetate hydrolase family protein [Candidatus Kapabacteria bacterium]